MHTLRKWSTLAHPEETTHLSFAAWMQLINGFDRANVEISCVNLAKGEGRPN